MCFRDLDARVLACYISKYYNEHYHKEISPVKLQKTLYFCFAYFSAYIKSKKLEKYPKYLFTNRIEAWPHGPVVPDVYNERHLITFNNFDDFFIDNEMKEIITELLDTIFPLDDFKIVSIAQEDNCWKKKFKIWAENIENKIPTSYQEISKDDIIREYIRKYYK